MREGEASGDTKFSFSYFSSLGIRWNLEKKNAKALCVWQTNYSWTLVMKHKFNECFLFFPSFYSTFLSYGRNLTSVRVGTEYIQVMEAAQASTGLAGGIHGGSALQSVNHIAHLSGALIGVALIWMLSGISSEPDAQNNKK